MWIGVGENAVERSGVEGYEGEWGAVEWSGVGRSDFSASNRAIQELIMWGESNVWHDWSVCEIDSKITNVRGDW